LLSSLINLIVMVWYSYFYPPFNYVIICQCSSTVTNCFFFYSGSDTVTILVGNKQDLGDKREVKEEDIKVRLSVLLSILEHNIQVLHQRY